MAHLVPVPPPADYHVPRMKSFSVGSPDGIGQVLVWKADMPGAIWRVGTDNPDQVVATERVPSGYPDLRLFDLRGARKGLNIALFILKSDNTWQRYSEYVTVDGNIADRYAAALLAGTLPKSRHHKRISFYPFGAQQAADPMTETEWMDKVDSIIGTLNTNTVGRCVLSNLSEDIVIYPFLPHYKNAWSTVMINPKQWEGEYRPGACADEILLHELIHIIEENADNYENRYGFMFDGTDFLTVNATNVYSCMLGRALRKDHHEFQQLPSEHFRNPRLHYQQQAPNYMKASGNAGDLVRTLATIKGVWNPFFYWSEYFERISFGH